MLTYAEFYGYKTDGICKIAIKNKMHLIEYLCGKIIVEKVGLYRFFPISFMEKKLL